MKEKTDNIDILEEMIKPIATRTFIFPDGRKEEKEIYNLERKQIEAISTLIAENKELKEENEKMEELIENSECDMSTNYIRKSKVEEIIEELRNDTCKIINRTYIPTISSKLFNNNREKYEPMLEARNILINALNKLQSLLRKE